MSSPTNYLCTADTCLTIFTDRMLINWHNVKLTLLLVLLVGVAEIQVGNAPEGTLRFSNSTYSVYLPENSQYGTHVVTVSAQLAIGGAASIQYSITSGNEQDTFMINTDSGKSRIFHCFVIIMIG